MSDATITSEMPVSPVLRLVTHLLTKETQSGETIKPQAWIMELLGGMKAQLDEAGLDFEGHAGLSGCAFLRDPLAGVTADQRPITRFHAARGFMEEAIDLANKRLQANPDDERMQLRVEMRQSLLGWVEEAEKLYDQQHKPGGISTLSEERKKQPEKVAEEPEEPATEVPLSFLNPTQQDSARKELLALLVRDDVALEDSVVQVLRELERMLTRVDPETPYLCRRTLGPADSVDGAVCSVFAVMSEPGISAYERAWLSDLGSFLVALKADYVAATATATAAATPAPAAPEATPQAAQPSAPAAASEELPAPAPEPDPEPEPAPTPAAVPETGPVRKPAPASGLTPPVRQQIKHTMRDRFAAWENAESVWTQRQCLENLRQEMTQLELDNRLIEALQVNDFVAAESAVEDLEAANAQDRKLKRQGSMVLQDVQTAYMYRLREILDLSVFTDQEQRRSTLESLVGSWQEVYESSEGKTEKRMQQADQSTLQALKEFFSGQALSDSCRKFFETQIEKAETVELLWTHLIKEDPSHPVTHLFCSQLKGFVEDIDLLRAFRGKDKEGWDKLITILAGEHPISESELVAILSRKIDALGITQAHENFMNPTRNLRLANYLNWVRNGYVMSPSFADSPEERTVIAHLAWLLEQLSGLTMMGEEDASLDDFLVEEANGGYLIYAAFVAEIGKRFESWYAEWRRENR